MTGCGKSITNDLLQGKAAPQSFTVAMDAIVQRAISQNCRIWIDSEQQAVQPTIDRWTIDLMRKHNRGGHAVIYNTIQAYFKTARAKLEYQLQLAHAEGWTLALKLVRGAYIDNGIRARIHDTKAATDAAYDAMVHDLLHGTIRGVPTGPGFPRVQLFLAGHNRHSVARASALVRTLHARGTLRTLPEFGQLQGMADQLGCELLQEGEDAVASAGAASAAGLQVFDLGEHPGMHAVSGAAGGGEPGGDGRGEGWDAGARKGVKAAGGGCVDGAAAAVVAGEEEDVGVKFFRVVATLPCFLQNVTGVGGGGRLLGSEVDGD